MPFILGYEPIFKQRDRCQLELCFLLLIDLGVLLEFYLNFDPLVDIGSDPEKFMIGFGLEVLSRFHQK
jgi:hypothetical protein